MKADITFGICIIAVVISIIVTAMPDAWRWALGGSAFLLCLAFFLYKFTSKHKKDHAGRN
jgi:Ca2+/Na+ antiporter